MNDLTNLFWDEHFRDKDPKTLSKIKQKIYDWLNRVNFSGFGVDNKIFWIELISIARLPNYIRTYMIKWAKRKGYSYLYNDIKKEKKNV